MLALPAAALASCEPGMAGMGMQDRSALMTGMVSTPTAFVATISKACCEVSPAAGVAASSFLIPPSHASSVVPALITSMFGFPPNARHVQRADLRRPSASPAQSLLCVFLI